MPKTSLPPGFFLINKPVDWTSFDVVNYVRKAAQHCHPEHDRPNKIRLEVSARTSEGSPRLQGDSSVASLPQNDRKKKPHIKVGHAGTLDPFATGLLIVGVGREATKHLEDFKNLPKTYVATVHLGATTDTQDVTGVMVKSEKLKIKNEPTQEDVQSIIKSFQGIQSQLPPMHSAKKIGGVRLYKLARQGKEVERKPNEVEIYDIKLLEYEWPLLKIEVACSAGTYIRTLAHDIGQKLGVGAYCEMLERTAIGPYHLSEATDVQDIDKLNLGAI